MVNLHHQYVPVETAGRLIRVRKNLPNKMEQVINTPLANSFDDSLKGKSSQVVDTDTVTDDVQDAHIPSTRTEVWIVNDNRDSSVRYYTIRLHTYLNEVNDPHHQFRRILKK